MGGTNGKKALHVATFSGWYRFEQDGKELRQTKRDLTYWTLTCMSVDPDNPQKIYAGSEHSGLFYTENAGARWKRAEPNTPKMMLFSALALNDGVMVGTIIWLARLYGLDASGLVIAMTIAKLAPSADEVNHL